MSTPCCCDRGLADEVTGRTLMTGCVCSDIWMISAAAWPGSLASRNHCGKLAAWQNTGSGFNYLCELTWLLSHNFGPKWTHTLAWHKTTICQGLCKRPPPSCRWRESKLHHHILGLKECWSIAEGHENESGNILPCLRWQLEAAVWESFARWCLGRWMLIFLSSWSLYCPFQGFHEDMFSHFVQQLSAAFKATVCRLPLYSGSHVYALVLYSSISVKASWLCAIQRISKGHWWLCRCA